MDISNRDDEEEFVFMDPEEQLSLENKLTQAFLESLSGSVLDFIMSSLEKFNRSDVYYCQYVIMMTLINMYANLIENETITKQEFLEFVNVFNTDFNDFVSDYLQGKYSTEGDTNV